MPHFTITFGRYGPVTDVVLGQSYSRVRMREADTGGKPLRTLALIDSGASDTCIDATIIRTLGLQPLGVARLRTPSTMGQVTTTSVYQLSLILSHPGGVDTSLTLPSLSVSAIDLSAEPFKVLIGRDVLRHCVLTYNGTQGWLTVAF